MMKVSRPNRKFKAFSGLFSAFFLLVGFLPAPLLAESPASGPRPIAILPSTDTSGLQLGAALQNALVHLYTETQAFAPQLATYQLGAFTAPELVTAHQKTGQPLISFTYLEKDRIAVFLFDSSHPGQFIVATELLSDQSGAPQVTSQFIEQQFRSAFSQVVDLYARNQFQPLPGTKAEEGVAKEETEEAKRRAVESKKLFRELAAIQDDPLYFGANIGMARFSSGAGSASTVDFGAFLGYRLSERFRLEGGFDVFSYLIAHLDTHYQLPIAENYVSLGISLGVARIVTEVTQNIGFQAASFSNGQMFFGPGFSFNIPLLGADIRGDLRIYVGAQSILLGTYGISYSL